METVISYCRLDFSFIVNTRGKKHSSPVYHLSDNLFLAPCIKNRKQTYNAISLSANTVCTVHVQTNIKYSEFNLNSTACTRGPCSHFRSRISKNYMDIQTVKEKLIIMCKIA